MLLQQYVFSQTEGSLRTKKTRELTDADDEETNILSSTENKSLPVLSPRKMENAPLKNVSKRRRKRTANRVSINALSAHQSDTDPSDHEGQQNGDDMKGDTDNNDNTNTSSDSNASSREVAKRPKRRRRPRSNRDSKNKVDDDSDPQPPAKKRKIVEYFPKPISE